MKIFDWFENCKSILFCSMNWLGYLRKTAIKVVKEAMVERDRDHSPRVGAKGLLISGHVEHHLLDGQVQALEHQRVGQGSRRPRDDFTTVFRRYH